MNGGRKPEDTKKYRAVTTKNSVVEVKYNTWGHNYSYSSTSSQVSNSRIRPPKPAIGFDASPFKLPSQPSQRQNAPSSIAKPLNNYLRPRNASVSSPNSAGINLNYLSPYRTNAQARPSINQSQSLSNLNERPSKLDIKVKKSIKFLDGDSKIPVYKTRSKNRGKALIINNIKFDDSTLNRKGAEVDQDRLKKLFSELGRWKAAFETNLTKQGMLQRLKSFKTDSTGKQDIYMIIIMSHGNGNETSDSSTIIGRDGQELPINVIIDLFKDFMPGKPKIFIFQCCRGEKRDTGIVTTDTNRNGADMLFAYATVPGHVSHRDTSTGTWYIQLLCETIMEHAHDTHIEDLLKIVDDKLSRLKTTIETRQTSNYESRGFKRCYLHPGLWD